MPDTPAKAIARDREREPVIQFSVFIPNRIGRLHEVTCRLAEREVHILALTVLDTTDSTILRMVVDDPDRARSLLDEHDFPFTEVKVLAVEVAGEGRLRDVLSALLEAELNIHYTYPFLTRPGGRSALVVSIEDQEVAEDILRRHEFDVLYQPDLSR
ncbi:MAG: acetolactate synthase [Verrucomicrobiae bacterium]|nr:acetolactate synthase [Verrucomicrobiae bacterium]